MSRGTTDMTAKRFVDTSKKSRQGGPGQKNISRGKQPQMSAASQSDETAPIVARTTAGPFNSSMGR